MGWTQDEVIGRIRDNTVYEAWVVYSVKAKYGYLE